MNYHERWRQRLCLVNHGPSISPTMSTMQKAMIAGFTAAERDYVRRELDQFFSTLPTVADGFLLKTCRSGPQAGQPKVPLAAKGLVERGLEIPKPRITLRYADGIRARIEMPAKVQNGL